MDKQPLTITALTKYLKYRFDNDTNLQEVLLRGEISNFKHHFKGHYYFTLKDSNAQISAIMFSNQVQNVNIKLENGMSVIVEGYVSLYLQGGSYQIYVNNIILDGLGELYLKYEKLKEKLFNQGMFDEVHKKQIPKFPKKIGIITSNTGAAIRDIITTIERRFPLVELIIFPTLVQGENAKVSIVKSIEEANRNINIDLIILGRGGGSIEDLWCFNEELVANAIFNSRIPIISAVGHETDFTISDFVADKRAATPTAAAEISVPDKRELLNNLNLYNNNIRQVLVNKIKTNKNLLNKMITSYVYINPKRIYEQNYYKLDKLLAVIEKNSPYNKLENKKQNLDILYQNLKHNYEKKYQESNNSFLNIVNKLELLNPLNILQRGYSIVKKDDKPLINLNDININDNVEVFLKDGKLNCRVISKEVNKYE